jgi:hypothetical protein
MDLFIDCTGGRVAPQRLWLSLHAPSDLITSVDQYRLVQAVDRSVRLEVVSQDELDPVAAAATAASYGRLLDVPIEVVRIGALPRDRNGRIRTFTSAAERVD